MRKTKLIVYLITLTIAPLKAQHLFEYRKDSNPPSIERSSESPGPEFFPEVTTLDTIYFKWFSKYLTAFDESSLSNYQFQHETYRLTIIESFTPPYVIMATNESQVCKIVVKKGKEINPSNTYNKFVNLSLEDSVFLHEYSQGKTHDSHRANQIISKHLIQVKDSTNFEFDKYELKYKPKECDDFKTNFKFRNLSVSDHNWIGTDGIFYILEANTPNGYFVAYRWSPDKYHSPEFKGLCLSLIKLAKVR